MPDHNVDQNPELSAADYERLHSETITKLDNALAGINRSKAALPGSATAASFDRLADYLLDTRNALSQNRRTFPGSQQEA